MADGNDSVTEVGFGDIAAEVLGTPVAASESGDRQPSGDTRTSQKAPSQGGDEYDESADDEANGEDDDSDEETDDEPEDESEGDDQEDDDEESPEDEESDEEDEDGDDEEEESPEPEPGNKKLLKRVGKLTARVKERDDTITALTAEKADLETKLATASPIQIVPTADNPLGAITSLETLDHQVGLAEQVLAWAEDNADGAEVRQQDGSVKAFTAEEVRNRARQAKAILKAAPERREYLAQQPNIDAEVKVFYPGLDKVGSPEHGTMVDLLKKVPGLARHPAYKVLIGDMMEGQKLRMARYEALQKKSKPSKEKGKSQPKGEGKQKLPGKGSPTKLPATPKASGRSAQIPAGKTRAAQAAAKRVADGDRSDAAITGFIEDAILG